jgi:hypothetical protein
VFRRRSDSDGQATSPDSGVYRTPLPPGFELSLPDLWARLRRKLRRSQVIGVLE